jgi:UDP-N-acetylmuramate-alanine ligase
MDDSSSDSTNLERKVATKLWPHHAEMCSDHDWVVISRAVEQDRSLSKSTIEPIGESKDDVLASLTILYWTMKLAHLAIQISNEVSGLHGAVKVKAVVAAVAKRMDSNTPKIVSDQVHEVVENLGIQ